MTSIKIFLRQDKVIKRNFEYPVALQIIKDRKKKILYTPYTCKKEWWDAKENRPDKNKHPNFKSIVHNLDMIRNKAEGIILDLDREKAQSGRDYSIDDFVLSFVGKKKTIISVYEYFTDVVSRFEATGKFGNAGIYKSTCNVLFTFHPNKNLTFQDIDFKFLRKFEESLLAKGNNPNGIFVYMRTLRALINLAIKEDYCKQELYPFKNKFISPNGYDPSKLSRPTRKRALGREQMKMIVEYKAPAGTHIYDSKNAFLFSFYNRGMNFKDIALLKRKNINNGRVEYTRAKTGKNFSIKLLTPVIAIIDYYKAINPDSDYVFPYITEHHKTPKQIYERIKTALKQVNKDIQQIATELGIEISDVNITSYVARHSWGTIQKRMNQSTSKISEGYGHSGEKVTEIYLSGFEQNELDQMDENLLDL